MKTVEYYKATNGVQICYTGYNWLVGLNDINEDAKKLLAEARRICKAVGIWNEYTYLTVSLVFNENKIFVGIGGGYKEECERIVEEAQKRHFKWTVGNDAA